MARRTTVSLISDLSDKIASETVSFALDGVSYEVDLTAREAKQLRAALATFINCGRRLTSTRRTDRRTGPADRGYLEEIRSWASNQGHQVSSRGRIPQRVIDAYNATH